MILRSASLTCTVCALLPIALGAAQLPGPIPREKEPPSQTTRMREKQLPLTVSGCIRGKRLQLSSVFRGDGVADLLNTDQLLLEGPDNLCAAPFGDLIVCEDHPGRDRVIGLSPNGRTYTIAANAQNDSEFAGARFSADGRTLFVNSQQPGTTFAVWGPWEKRQA